MRLVDLGTWDIETPIHLDKNEEMVLLDGSEDGPVKFYKKGYCRYCGGVQLIDKKTLRCAECHRR